MIFRTIFGLSSKKGVSLFLSKETISSSNRCFSLSAANHSQSWKKLFVREIEPVKESQSDLLSNAQQVYELQIHRVKSQYMADYLQNIGKLATLLKNSGTGAELAASWTCDIGQQDEAIHLWKFSGGYKQLSKHYQTYRNEPQFAEIREARNTMLRQRKNQICLNFSFWPEIGPREGPNIYELRSYTLKPGTMIEWGNYWARGIKYRQHDSEPVAGLFSHIGDLQEVHHIWGYKDLEHRKMVRDSAWRAPGWDECVLHTVPLIQKMTAKILIPTPFSPVQ